MPTSPVVSHIRVDEQGTAWIDDTRVKVVEVVLDQLAYGWTAEEMHLHQPHLSLAQIHAALAYYYDNQKELDQQIRERDELADSLREQFEDKALRRRLQQARQAK